MRVLITGINGFIGKKVARALSHRGHSVFGVSLEPSPMGLPEGTGYQQLDLTQFDEVDTLLRERRFDAVVHLAALVHVRKSELGFADYAKVNYYTSEHLFERAAAAGVGRLAFASTVEVYGPKPEGTVVDENTTCQPDSEYGRSKLLAEESVRRIARTHDIAHCNLRFAPVYASDFRLNLDKRLYLKAPWVGYYLGRGDYRLSLCSVRNIEAWLERWLGLENAPSGTFNLADERAYPVRELLDLERRHHQLRAVLSLPMLPSLSALAVRELMQTLRGRDPGMYTVANFRKLGRSTVYAVERARDVLGPLPGNVERDLYERS
jgi:nucleoside-diphosphate-sugar epimerase